MKNNIKLYEIRYTLLPNVKTNNILINVKCIF